MASINFFDGLFSVLFRLFKIVLLAKRLVKDIGLALKEVGNNMKLNRNDICWCGSNIKYKYCHYDLDAALSNEYVQVARKVYNRNWQKNSAHYAEQGCYDWMASLLKPYSPGLILDIGCGDGSGIRSLLSMPSDRRVQVVSLEENSECIDTARSRLSRDGYEVSAVKRLHSIDRGDKKHVLGIESGCLGEICRVTLIEADVLLDDEELFSFLFGLPKFDAVTVWLVGTHLARQNCINISPLKINSSAGYRLRVQNKVYELADKLLKPNGVLQVVDRCEVPSTEALKEDFIQAHCEQASVTSLKVNALEYLPYNEPESVRKIPMRPTIGKSGRLPDLSRKAMVSVISQKP